MATSFPDTPWPIFSPELTAEQKKRSEDELVRLYRPPLLWVLGTLNVAESEREDLLHDFFLKLFTSNFVREIDPSMGRLRTILAHRLRLFTIERSRAALAKKRGGGLVHIEVSETIPADDAIASEQLERLHVISFLYEAIARVRREANFVNKPEEFDLLLSYVLDGRQGRDLEALLGCTNAALKSRAYSLRNRLGKTLLSLVRKSVDPRIPHALEEELECFKEHGVDLTATSPMKILRDLWKANATNQ